jgi:hypothetical protein
VAICAWDANLRVIITIRIRNHTEVQMDAIDIVAIWETLLQMTQGDAKRA